MLNISDLPSLEINISELPSLDLEAGMSIGETQESISGLGCGIAIAIHTFFK